MTEDQTKATRQGALRKAYGQATALLREQHRDEFDGLYAQEAKALGVDYTPRPSAEQRALQQIEALLNEHPALRNQFDFV